MDYFYNYLNVDLFFKRVKKILKSKKDKREVILYI